MTLLLTLWTRFAGSRIGRPVAMIGAVLLGVLAIYGKGRRDQRRDAQLEDYEHAEDIEGRVDDSRADPDRLRKYDDAGWRDDGG